MWLLMPCCVYSADSPGTVHTKSEYTYFDIVNEDNSDVVETSVPVLAGIEACVAGGLYCPPLIPAGIRAIPGIPEESNLAEGPAKLMK